jgi:hypothetical protein
VQPPFPLVWLRAKTGFRPGEGGVERLCPIGIGHAQAGYRVCEYGFRQPAVSDLRRARSCQSEPVSGKRGRPRGDAFAIAPDATAGDGRRNCASGRADGTLASLTGQRHERTGALRWMS